MKLDYEFRNSLSPILSVRRSREYREGEKILFWRHKMGQLVRRPNIIRLPLFREVEKNGFCTTNCAADIYNGCRMYSYIYIYTAQKN